MLGPVSGGGAIDLLLDCGGQSVKSALSLYVSCPGATEQNRERKQQSLRRTEQSYCSCL